MVRLLQALAGAAQGGAEMHFVRLAEALARVQGERAVEQEIVMRGHPEAAQRLAEAGLPITVARFGGFLDLSTGRVLKKVIRRFRPDVALTYMSRASAWMPKGDFVHIGRLGGYYDLKYFRNCDHLVGITPDIVEHCVRSGHPRERCHVIPNFVLDRRAEPHPRAALETPEDAPLIFALGRLHENKAFDILLQAVAKVPGAWLWLAGEGPLREKLKQQARDLGIESRVRFLGWQSNPLPYFAAADVYVVPSRHEPLGSVVLEGWMARVPMVAAASQGPSWLIEEGETGLLVPIDEADAMAGAIRRILDDPELAARLVAQGRRAYEEGFTEAVAVRRYLDLFDRVLGR